MLVALPSRCDSRRRVAWSSSEKEVHGVDGPDDCGVGVGVVLEKEVYVVLEWILVVTVIQNLLHPAPRDRIHVKLPPLRVEVPADVLCNERCVATAIMVRRPSSRSQ